MGILGSLGRKVGFLTSSAMMLALAVPASAQEGSELRDAGEPASTGNDIVVTGSRIARPDLQVASPVNVIGQEEIQLRQPNTAEDLLRDLPSVRPSLGSATNSGGDGSSNVDLRGLGTNRTLVLLDGKRIVPFGLDGIVDLNTIPTTLIERVDVTTGGASSVYGADAVAGVVNFITKKNFVGFQLDASNRITQRGDANQYRADLLIGANLDDGRGNAVLGIGYMKRNSLTGDRRSVSAVTINSANGLFSGSQATIPVLFTSPSSTALGLGSGSLGAILNPATGSLRLATQSDLQDTAGSSYIQSPLDRFNIYAAARYELTPGIEAYASGSFVRNESAIQQTASATFTATYNLPLSNAYLPVGVRNQLCAARSISAAQCALAAAATTPTSANYREVPVIAQRRFLENGPRGNLFESQQFQVEAGFRGDLAPAIKFDVSAQYGETSQNQTLSNWGSYSKLQQALRSYVNTSGTPVCSDTSNGCVPMNLFGPLGSVTDSMLDFIGLEALVRRKVTLGVVTGNISGDLFGITSPLADKPIAFSIGAEYRRLTAKSIPDAATQTQGEVLGYGTRTPPTSGFISVKEAFGELIVPLVSDRPFLYSLQAEAGLRYSDYSTTGGSATWKAGGSFEPIQGFKFRGMYQVAVRSPNISELFQAAVTSAGNLSQDPCQSNLPVGNAGLTALCIATGAPASSIGSISAPSSSQINVTTSGNPNLGVEKARTYTLGLVLTPPQVRNFSMTVDYFHIKITDAISTPAAGDILNGCYSAALNPNYTPNAFCQLVARNPLNGSLNGGADTPGVILAGSNLGVIQTAGIDFGMNYRLDLASLGLGGNPGALKFGLSGTYLQYYHYQATPNSINRDCTASYSTNCTNPRPQWKWNGRVGYSNGGVDVSLLWTRIGSVHLEDYNATVITPLTTPQGGGPNPSTVLEAFRKIKAYDFFDLSTQFRVSEKFGFNILVENLFDKKPPLVGSGVGGNPFNNGNTFPTTYDILGRTFTVSASLKF
ncbi:outer membrane receptor protein involved in Fe transport [Sphingobium sp. B11D3B]|uniref:TonB-dependent receptor plug domain-containing protein n=1 Tax=Sphingobium sp. B11D3B TaxID=2940575 RepID=UPI002227FFBE|nr:TonB-dependent receptor [Sphingobium sp. B11D3B]MCW2387196.1 outer membrane receptor protein involved in Fe transport [Sphingobium sp. B11D3B]